jgi:hypothetical protein
MIVDLMPLPYKIALDIIHFCVDHKIDQPKCFELLEALSLLPSPVPEIEWTLDLPEQYLTWIILKQDLT